MINNLFSVFDPSTSLLSMSWLLLFLIPLRVPIKIWKPTPPKTKKMNMIIRSLFKEIKFSTRRKKSQEILLLLVFILLVSLNAVALYPQVSSISSHLIITLPLSLTLWTAINLFGWLKNTNHILSHLVPQGTPGPLMIFIVIIELVRNIIRPITLCVRLTANIIAGHLLITLLGNSLISLSKMRILPRIVAPIILTILESAVAVIQAYVFITLITLYIAEAK